MKVSVLVICLAAVLIGGAGYGYYWHYVAGRLQAGISDWATQQRSLGHEIAFENNTISGFPLAFRTSFRKVTLSFVQPAGTFSVEAETLVAQMRPWNLQDITVTSETPVALALASPAPSGGAPQTARVRNGTARIQLQPSGQLKTAAIEANSVTVDSRAGTYAAEKALAAIELPATMPVDYHQPLLSFDLTVSTLTLPLSQRAVTDAPIEKLAAKGAIMGPVPASIDLPAAMMAWANTGGTVELKSFDFVQAPLILAGEGTVALDEALQPLGALTIRAQGLPETIDLLQRDGRIDARAAKTGGMMAKGLARPDEAGRQVVSVSLSLQQGYLWLGPIRITQLPSLRW